MSTDVSVTALEEVRELIDEGRELGAVAIARVADVVELADLSEEQQAVRDAAAQVLGGALTEAISMYRSSGYEEIPDFNGEPYAHHWFEKQLPTSS